MKVDAIAGEPRLRWVPAQARLAEVFGFDALHTAPTARDPFGRTAAAAGSTTRLGLRPLADLGRPWNPEQLARRVADLHDYTRGRLALTLKAAPDAVPERTYDLIQRLRAAWSPPRPPWRGTRHRVLGSASGPAYDTVTATRAPWPVPTVHLQTARPRMIELAGEAADGVVLPGLASARWLRETVVPRLERGLRRAGRTFAEFEVSAPVLVITGATQESAARAERLVRERIALSAATPAYRPVLERHGWGDLHLELAALARRGAWAQLPALIENEVVEAFAVRGAPEEIPELVVGRYGAICRRVRLDLAFHDDPGVWPALVARVHAMTCEPVPS